MHRENNQRNESPRFLSDCFLYASSVSLRLISQSLSWERQLRPAFLQGFKLCFEFEAVLQHPDDVSQRLVAILRLVQPLRNPLDCEFMRESAQQREEQPSNALLL